MKRPTNRTLLVLAGAVALGAGGATVGIAASGGGGSSPAKDLADALNQTKGTHLTEADVQAAMQAAFKARLDAAVKAGRLTQAQADAMLQRAKDAPQRRARYEAARAARIAPVAKLLGMTADEIHQKLEGGTTLAKLAESKGVSRDALLAAIKEGIAAEAKAEGVTFTDARLNELAARVADGTGGPRGEHHGFGRHGGPGRDGFGPDFGGPGGPPFFPPLGP
jgi:hypothetical protein